MEAVTPGIVLVRADDPVLLADAVRALIHEAADGEDPGLGLADFSTDDYEPGAVVDAACTPPMFTARRIVVARDVGRFSKEEVEPLVAYCDDPSPTAVVILVSGGGVVARKLFDAVKRAGQIREAGAPVGKGRGEWIADRVRQAPVILEPRAVARLQDHLGEDVSRLSGILNVLSAVFGDGNRVTALDLEPFLGAAGARAPWDLTDAIDGGDTGAALDHLGRMLGGGARHPLQITATLQTHYGRMLRLDGAGAVDEQAAANALGLTGSTFPARKVLQQTRKLGHAGVSRAIQLLADADLDLRGRRDVPGETTLEILVARLCRLSGRPTARPRARR